MTALRNLLSTLCLVAAAAVSSAAWGADGLVSIKSPYAAHETMTRLENLVKERGLTVFARIDHAAGAAKIGMTLRATDVLIFGNPQGGTPLLMCAQTVGIDLPLKALVWEEASAQVWLSYNDIAFLARRHEAPDCPAVASLRRALAGIAEAVTTK